MATLMPHVVGYLREGMPVDTLRKLGSGCTTPRTHADAVAGVCPRLDKLRRRYGR